MSPSELELHLRMRLSAGRKLFVPYLTAGLPSPQGFVDLVDEMGEFADAIEVGIPFSDPIMDGPVIQEASTRALRAGATVVRCFEMIREALRHGSSGAPIVVMTYFNPVHRMGHKKVADAFRRAGVRGLIVPDLPFEESEGVLEAMAAAGIASVQMVAPTTSPERARMLAAGSTGFVYAVSRMGVTGERQALDRAARAVVRRIRPHTRLPILLGIGISNGVQARSAAALADGVIVGSAIMKKVLDGDLLRAVGLAREIRAALG
ncbi:MAG: tryptophan synthase subunit alpha [Actinomycetota bacterium]